MLRLPQTIAFTALFTSACLAQTLPLPARGTNSISAADFIRQIGPLPLAEREQVIASEILSGNVPSRVRELHPVTLSQVADGKTNVATFFVTRDYLGVGHDTDFFRTPLTPATAQRIADELGCTLPTRKMVDAIHGAAGIKLTPQPIPPNAAMTTVPVFAVHNEFIRTQLFAIGVSPTSTALIAGHKKDVVIPTNLAALTDNVAIYGWHRTNGTAIQPLYTKHRADWVDYSHGIRLVQQQMILNGQTTTVARVLADPKLASLLSDDGVIAQSRYLTRKTFFDERITTLSPAPEVTVEINSPPAKDFTADKPVLLVLYALPNGNTIAQTVGKKLLPGDDWHFDIQHIGAQTRFLRAAITNRTLVVAYLEAKMKSWPAWRRKHGDNLIPDIIGAIKQQFPTNKLELVLTGHSGGGSFTFGYLNAVTNIPADVKRIAFLDSNYAYETTNHFTKLANWLKQTNETSHTNRSVPIPGHSNVVSSISADQFQAARNLNIAAPGDGRTPPDEFALHHLCVLAYHDSIALLEGKTFVSERGGTWGRSHAMLTDLRREFPFTSHTNSAGLQSHVAANGQIQFLLKENPEKKILHTVQVSRNGFIHAMLTGTPLENIGYEYFGERAYERWIQPS